MLATMLSHKNRRNLCLIILVIFGNTSFGQTQTIIKAESILKNIEKKKPIFLENTTIEGNLDFTKLKDVPESPHTERVLVASPIYFKNCRFKGKIIGFADGHGASVLSYFQTNLSFFNCTFYDGIFLNGAIVGTSLVLAESKIHGELHLENLSVGQDANFVGTIFGRKTFFQNGSYRKNAFLNKTIFTEVANFQSCKWEGEVVFRESEFRDNMDFSLQKTSSSLSFNLSQFKKTVSFEGSRFGDNLELDQVSAERLLLNESSFFGKIHLEGLKCKSLNLAKAIFYAYKPDFAHLNSETELDLSGICYLNTGK